MKTSNGLQHLTTAFSRLNLSDAKLAKDSLLKAVKGCDEIKKIVNKTVTDTVTDTATYNKFSNSLVLNISEPSSLLNTKTTYAKPPYSPSTLPIFRLFTRPTSETSKEAGPSFESLLH